MIKRMEKIALTLIFGGGIGLALLLFAYMISTEPMIRNAKASIDIFKVEGTHPQVIHGYQATTLDNYTDAWMLRNAFYNGEESVWEKSLNVYSYGYTNGQTNNLCESMIAWLEGKEGYERVAYARYWHGYLVILKPLLYFFDYGDIREILKFLSLAMIIYICVLLEKIHMSRFIPAFAAAMACMEFHTIGMSMQYTWVFIIAIFFSIIILKRYQNTTQKPVPDLLFLVIGMMTSYFDFLTYPVFTLGIPLIFLTICMREYGNAISLPAMALKNSVYWAVGYIGMWVQKWILCTIFTGENLIADGIHSIMMRSGRDVMGEQIGYWETLYGNIIVIAKYPYVLVFGAAGLIIFFLCKKYNREHKSTFSKTAFMTYVYIAALPFLWYAISINHSYIHSFMAYKSLSITVFAALCAFIDINNCIGNFVKAST